MNLINSLIGRRVYVKMGLHMHQDKPVPAILIGFKSHWFDSGSSAIVDVYTFIKAMYNYLPETADNLVTVIEGGKTVNIPIPKWAQYEFAIRALNTAQAIVKELQKDEGFAQAYEKHTELCENRTIH